MRFDNVLTCLIALTDLSNNAKSLTEHLETISVGKSTACLLYTSDAADE